MLIPKMMHDEIDLFVVYDRNHYFGSGPIPKPKPKLADTFGRYCNRYRDQGESSYRFPIPQTNFGLTRVPTIANRDSRSHTTSPTIDLFLKLGFHGACYVYAILAYLCAFWGAATIPDNRGKSLVKVEEFYENKSKNPNKMNI